MQRGEIRWYRFGAPDAVNLDHLQTVSRERMGGVITTLPADRMAEVRTALLFALGFPEDR